MQDNEWGLTCTWCGDVVDEVKVDGSGPDVGICEEDGIVLVDLGGESA